MASDCAGNTTPLWTYGLPLTVELHQQSDPAITYSGNWTTSSLSGSSGGSVTYATAANASASFSYTGHHIAWVSTKGPTRGSAQIYLDGVLKQKISLNASKVKTRQIVFRSGASQEPITQHNITIVVLGTAGHPRVDIDGFVVLS